MHTNKCVTTFGTDFRHRKYIWNTTASIHFEICAENFVHHLCDNRVRRRHKPWGKNFDRPKRSVVTSDTRSRKIQSWIYNSHGVRKCICPTTVTYDKTAKSCMQWDSELQVTLTFLLLHLSKYLEQIPFWEGNRFSHSQNVLHILENLNVHYRTHKGSPPVPILSQIPMTPSGIERRPASL